MENNVFSSFLGQITLNVLQILTPTFIVLLVILVVYTLLQIISAKFLEKSDQKFSKLLVGGFSKTLSFLIEKLPSILILLAVITGLSLVINIGNQFYEISQNQKRIKELTVFVRNLSNNDKIAQITVKEKGGGYNDEYGVYKIDIYDGVSGDVVSEKEYTLPGRVLSLDSMVINFDYSEIGSGTQKNLAFPYRIFSNRVSAKNGTILENIFTSSESDTMIENSEEAMLGLSREAYRQRAKEFIQIINDPLQRQELGIRSSYGNTITIPVNAQPGDAYAVYVEGSGGLSFKKID